MKPFLAAFRLDGFIVAIVSVIVLALFLPVTGALADTLQDVSKAAIALLFFLYGARLHPSAIWNGLANWRLQSASLAMTFVIIPIAGFLLFAVFRPVVDQTLLSGFLFLSMLPSTVQSSIAMVGVARGNVAGAICCASLSNLLGVFLTPLLALLLLDAHVDAVDPAAAIGKVAAQILLPFVVGMACHRLMNRPLERFGPVLKFYDRAVILLIAYMAISAAVVGQILAQVDLGDLAILVALILVLLTIAMWGSWLFAGPVRLPSADRIALLFCGSQKSLASGLPLAAAIFSPDVAGVIMVPVIIYHQIQLVVGTILCGQIARTSAAD